MERLKHTAGVVGCAVLLLAFGCSVLYCYSFWACFEADDDPTPDLEPFLPLLAGRCDPGGTLCDPGTWQCTPHGWENPPHIDAALCRDMCAASLMPDVLYLNCTGVE